MALHRIGNYELLGELGRGGMGVVYRGVDSFIKRQVAIKTIYLSEIQEEQERQFLRERLYREAQSAGILSHPNIVTIYQIGEQDEITYIAMEFVDGHNLADVLRKRDQGQVTLEFLATLFAQTASALDHAHSKGVIHRDVKPANIIVRNDGVAKITDFGIAKISSQTVTRTGMTLGTPHFMAPEQIQGKPLDGRADQYSLGVVMYEAITGKRPFTADSMTTLIFKIVSDEPDPKRDNPQLSDAVSAVLKKALAKHPDDRYPNCMALAQAFREAAGLSGVTGLGPNGAAEANAYGSTGSGSFTGTQPLPGGQGGTGGHSGMMPPPVMPPPVMAPPSSSTGAPLRPSAPTGAYATTGMPMPPPMTSTSVATPTPTPTPTPTGTRIPPAPPLGGATSGALSGPPGGLPQGGLARTGWQATGTPPSGTQMPGWQTPQVPDAVAPCQQHAPAPRSNVWLAPLLVVLGLALVGGIFGVFQLLRTSPEGGDNGGKAASALTARTETGNPAASRAPGDARQDARSATAATPAPTGSATAGAAGTVQTAGTAPTAGTGAAGQPGRASTAGPPMRPPGAISVTPSSAVGTTRQSSTPGASSTRGAATKPPGVAGAQGTTGAKPPTTATTNPLPGATRTPQGWGPGPAASTSGAGSAGTGTAAGTGGSGTPSSTPGAAPSNTPGATPSATPAGTPGTAPRGSASMGTAVVTTSPRPTLRVPAVYPAAARRDGVSGTVGLRALVGVDGVPSSIEVVKGIRPDLDKAASDALARWRFQPGTYEGKPVEARVNVEITFNLVQDSRKPVSLRNP